jgi:hypothetical protein
MSVLCFVIHSLDGEHTCWFSHFFDNLIVEKKNEDINRNKKKINILIQRIHRDFKVSTATVEYHNELSFEGCVLVNLEGEDVFVVYKQVQDFCFSMACKMDTNRVLASYVLPQIVIQILSSITASANTAIISNFDAKEFLLRPEHVYTILAQLIPHGRLLLCGNLNQFVTMDPSLTLSKK